LYLLLHQIFLFYCPWPLFVLLFLLYTYFLSPARILKLLSPSPKPREIPPAPDPFYIPPGLVSVHVSDAVLDSSSMTLSAIRIPIRWCQPDFQHSHKNQQRTHPRRRASRSFFSWYKWLFLSVLASNAVQNTYALPGTNHALVSNQPSRDSYRQQSYVQTAISNMTSNPVTDEPTGMPANAAPDEHRRNTPYCFIADTDSTPYIVDSGANRVILNDAKLFKSFKAQRGAVKGVGGNPVSIIGTGTLELSLQSDEGTVDTIEIDNAV
jgi:hypothetical protein